MITPELENYVKQARAQGLSDADIRKNLKTGGWTDADLNELLGVSESYMPTPSMIPPPPITTIAPEKSRVGLWLPLLIVIVFLFVGAWGGYSFYKGLWPFEKEAVTVSDESFPQISGELAGDQNLAQNTEDILADLGADTTPELITNPTLPPDNSRESILPDFNDQCVEPAPGLVAWYPGEDNSNDLKSNNQGAVKGAVAYAAGFVGQAFSLNGTDAYIEAPSTALIDPTGKGSLSAWVKFNKLPSLSARTMQIIGKGGDGTDFDLQADTYNKFRFYIGAGTNVSSTTVIKAGIWYHVVGTWDSTVGLKIYINGVLENTNTMLVTRRASGKNLQIGHQPTFANRFFNGLIDEASVWNRALTPEEVSAIFEADGAGLCKPTPVPTPTTPRN